MFFTRGRAARKYAEFNAEIRGSDINGYFSKNMLNIFSVVPR